MPLHLSRRASLVTGASTLVAVAAAVRNANAQPSVATGDWMAMVEQHHGLIERSFDELLRLQDQPFDRLALQWRTLEHLLNAHSFAEETVIYPALAHAGMSSEAEKLYLDEAHAKISSAQLQVAVAARQQQGSRAWVEPARQLQRLVLQHARQDEESRFFPALRAKLAAAENARLADQYPKLFGSVLPPRS